MRGAIKHLRELGATPILALVIVNKSERSDIDGVPLRSLIRAQAISA